MTSPGAAPMALQMPESTCDEIIPHDESRYIKLEKHEFFGGREGLGEAACVPMKLTVSVRFEIAGRTHQRARKPHHAMLRVRQGHPARPETVAVGKKR